MIEIFSTYGIVFVSVIAVAILGGCYYLFCVKMINKLVVDIKQVNEKIANISEEDAVNNFENINNIFNRHSGISDIWKEYSKTLISIMHGGKHEIYSTEEASSYFNFENITAKIDIPFWQNLGGVFTGIGILGTFLGLTIGLKDIDINTSDISQLKAGIGQLLDGIGLAFITSLVGIFAAIVFLFIHKLCLADLKNEIIILSAKIESIYVRRASEKWLAESYIQSTEQTNELKKFNTDLALSIGDALEAKFSEEVIPQFLPVLESIDSKMGELNAFNEERLPQVIEKSLENQFKETLLPTFDKLNAAIDKLNSSGVDAISKNLQGSAGKELDNFAIVLQRISDSLETSLEKMKDTSSEVDKNMNTMMAAIVTKLDKNMENVLETTARQQQGLSSVAEQINSELQNTIALMKDEVSQMVAKFGEGAQQQSEVITSNNNRVEGLITQMMDKFVDSSAQQYDANVEYGKKLGQQLEAVLNHFSQTSEMQKQQTLDNNNKTAELMRNIYDEFASASKEQHDNEIRHNKEISDSINNILEGFASESKRQSDLIIENGKQMRTSLDIMMKNYALEVEKLRSEQETNMRLMNDEFLSFIKKANEEIQEHLEVINGMAQGVENMLSDTKRIMREAGDTAISFSKAAEPVSNSTLTLERQLRKTIEANNDLNNSIDDRMIQLERIAEANGREIQKLMQGLERTQEDWQAYSRHFEGVSGELTTIVEMLDERIDAYNKKMQNAYVQSLDKYDESLSKAFAQLSSSIEELTDVLEYQKK